MPAEGASTHVVVSEGVVLVPFSTRFGARGMVTTVDHLASAAGVALLRAGGNAADAAIGANAVLAVTTQQSCGLGGDLFAVVHRAPGEVVALNASGRSGSGADASRLRGEGHTRMPFRGDIRSVPVPGCVDGWVALHERFGRLPLPDVLAPAIAYARDGFPASPLLAAARPAIDGVAGNDDYPEALRPGQAVRRPGVARGLASIASAGRAGWYEGEFGERLVALGAGEYSDADVRARHADWMEPLRVRAWGHDVWTVPPNSHAYITLAAAWIADGLDLPEDPDDPQWAHLLIEAAKQAGHDRPAVLHEHADAAALLDPARLDPRRAAIDPRRAAALRAPAAPGGTIHLNAADSEGLTVSLTQSNCSGFGAHLVVPELRVFLQNRGTGFSLLPGHPAEYGPRRRPPHTLSPAIVTDASGAVRYALGTMGADSQPMIILQLLARLLHARQSPARAVASARWILSAPNDAAFEVWDHLPEQRVRIEGHAPAGWAEGLRARGHDVEVADAFHGPAGHAHVIEVGADSFGGAADPRARTGGTAAW